MDESYFSRLALNIEASQLIFCANQLTGFYMRAILAFNELSKQLDKRNI